MMMMTTLTTMTSSKGGVGKVCINTGGSSQSQQGCLPTSISGRRTFLYSEIDDGIQTMK